MFSDIPRSRLKAMERGVLRRAAGEELLVLAALSGRAERRRIERELARRCNPARLAEAARRQASIAASCAA